MLSVGYWWELDVGGIVPWAHLRPGKQLLPYEANLEDFEAGLALARNQERVASYKQLAGYSRQIQSTTKGALSLDDFRLPEECNVRPVLRNEERKVERENGQNMVYLKNNQDGSRQLVLPAFIHRLRLLVLGLDQGSPGAAGVAFSNLGKQRMIHAHFDKIHRLIRDLVLAQLHTCRALFRKAKAFSAYVAAFNSRPFGSGSNATLKKVLLDHFQVRCDVHSPCFRKNVAGIGQNFGMPTHTEREQQDILDECLRMKSFVLKGTQPKLQNWFAWNSMMKETFMREFRAQRMIFEDHLGYDDATRRATGIPDPFDGGTDRDNQNPRKLLNQMLNEGGGVRLATLLMTDALEQHVKVLYTAENACWDWYTKEIGQTKHPRDGLLHSMRMADGGWKSEPHIWKTMDGTLFDRSKLEFMEIPQGVSTMAGRTTELVLNIVRFRGWSLAKHDLPPECYANALSPNPQVAQESCTAMMNDHLLILQLESDQHDFDDHAALYEDLKPVLNSPNIRCIYELYHRDDFSQSSADGRHLLSGHLLICADNKIVEDLHLGVRLKAKKGTNKKLASDQIQDVVQSSTVLEERGIRHSAALTKEEFCRKFKTTKVKSLRRRHEPQRKDLPKTWSRLVRNGQKDWPTLNEETLQRAAAAFSWLRSRGDNDVSAGLFSKWALPGRILAHRSSQPAEGPQPTAGHPPLLSNGASSCCKCILTSSCCAPCPRTCTTGTWSQTRGSIRTKR